MATGNPQFSQNLSLINASEKLRQERQAQWDQKKREIEEIADMCGKGIEEGVKDTIIALNINGISTSASCEGHFEVKGGHRPWPWVEISAPDEPEERFVGELAEFEDVASRHGVSLEQLKRGHPEELYWEVQKKCCENTETSAYMKWKDQNTRLWVTINKLLDEFYGDRISDIDIKLQTKDGHGGPFEISSETMSLVKFLDNEFSEEERERLLAILPKRQKEMQDFALFLKEKFFKEGGNNVESFESDKDEYKTYLEDLQLKPEDLNGRILDVGSGTALFGRYVNVHHKDAEVISVDPEYDADEKIKRVKCTADKIPFDDETFNLIVSDCAIPNIFLGEEPDVLKDKIEKSLLEMLRVTKAGGQIRLGKVAKGEIYDSQSNLVSALDETLNKLQRDFGVEIEEIHTPPDSYEYDKQSGEPTRLLAKVYLIVIRKVPKQ